MVDQRDAAVHRVAPTLRVVPVLFYRIPKRLNGQSLRLIKRL